MSSKYSNPNPFRSETTKPTIRTSSSSTAAAIRPYRLGDLRFAAAGFGRLWDPTVLDRLQVPLTRYHE